MDTPNFEEVEIVDVSEAGLDVETPPHPGAQVWVPAEESFSDFLARTRKPPVVRDGDYDTQRKR